MQFKVIDDLNLPYIKSINPATHTDRPYLVGGQNTLSQPGLPITRRPGFPLLATLGANERLHRAFTWQRWDGTFFTMYSVINSVAGTVLVYKSTDLASAVAADIHTEPWEFVVSNNFLFMSNGRLTRKWDGTTLTNWGIDPQPTTAPTIANAAAGNVPGAIGHYYVYAYGVSATGYVSDISERSDGTTAANRQWTVSGPRCTDTQCDRVHIYRTEDGGDTLYELSNSPIANPGAGNFSITDNDYDSTGLASPRLDIASPASIKGVNQKPPAMKGLKYFAGRIWGFSGDTVYFSGLEEVTNSVPEECFGTALTNSQSFGREVTGIEVLGGSDLSVLLVFTASAIYYVAGNSLLTFRIGTLSERRGCRNRAAIVAGQIDLQTNTLDFVAWLDTSNSVRMVTTNNGIRELSVDISPDIETITHAQASLAVYEDGNFKWLVLCDGAAAVLRVLDLGSGKWNTPWPIGTGTPTVVATGEISAGTHYLFLGVSNLILRLNKAVFADNAVAYTSHITMHLSALTERERPDKVANLEHVGIERNSHDISDIAYLLDEDPLIGSPSYTSMAASATTPFLRSTTAATNLVEKWYWLRDKAGSRRASIKISWAATGNDFKLFTVAITSSNVEDDT